MEGTEQTAAARITAVAGPVALAACAVAGAGGAAAFPGGAWQGWPGAATAVALAGAAGALAFSARRAGACGAAAGLLLWAAAIRLDRRRVARTLACCQ